MELPGGIEINLIMWYFIGISLLVNILCVSVNLQVMPDLFAKLFLFGKASLDRKTEFFHIPKSWFSHFYVIGSVEVTYAMLQVIQVNIVGRPAPSGLRQLLTFLTTEQKASCSPESVVLAMFLLMAQIYRRLYEHLFVHVTSTTTIHVGHYLSGVLHYVLGIAALLAAAPGFAPDDSARQVFSVTRLSWRDRACGAVFMLAWLHQYRANCIFASLRKDPTGAVVSRTHSIPRGDWFEYVSCPHYLAEVLMYTCLTVMIGLHNWSWLSLYLWVVSNQVGSALMSHNWYKQKFEDYPADRKAIIPYIL